MKKGTQLSNSWIISIGGISAITLTYLSVTLLGLFDPLGTKNYEGGGLNGPGIGTFFMYLVFGLFISTVLSSLIVFAISPKEKRLRNFIYTIIGLIVFIYFAFSGGGVRLF